MLSTLRRGTVEPSLSLLAIDFPKRRPLPAFCLAQPAGKAKVAGTPGAGAGKRAAASPAIEGSIWRPALSLVRSAIDGGGLLVPLPRDGPGEASQQEHGQRLLLSGKRLVRRFLPRTRLSHSGKKILPKPDVIQYPHSSLSRASFSGARSFDMPSSNEPLRSCDSRTDDRGSLNRGDRPYIGDKEPKFVIKIVVPIPY